MTKTTFNATVEVDGSIRGEITAKLTVFQKFDDRVITHIFDPKKYTFDHTEEACLEALQDMKVDLEESMHRLGMPEKEIELYLERYF